MASYAPDVDHATVIRWFEECHATTARLDMKTWLDNFMDPDISVKFFELPELSGRAQVEPAFEAFVGQLDGLEHEIMRTDYVPGCAYHQVKTSYLPKGGDPAKDYVVMMVMAVFHMKEIERKGEKWFRCKRMETYGDTSELFKKINMG